MPLSPREKKILLVFPKQKAYQYCLQKINIFVYSFTPFLPCVEIILSIFLHTILQTHRLKKKSCHFLFVHSVTPLLSFTYSMKNKPTHFCRKKTPTFSPKPPRTLFRSLFYPTSRQPGVLYTAEACDSGAETARCKQFAAVRIYRTHHSDLRIGNAVVHQENSGNCQNPANASLAVEPDVIEEECQRRKNYGRKKKPYR